MFRNMYDTDVTVWSPEGRLLQVGAQAARLSFSSMMPVADDLSVANPFPLPNT